MSTGVVVGEGVVEGVRVGVWDCVGAELALVVKLSRAVAVGLGVLPVLRVD